MGLDMVELIMEVEETFDITIPDDDASHILSSVGDLYHYILLKLPATEEGKCASAVAFYGFRRAAMAILGVERRHVRPRAATESIIPKRHRRTLWKRFSEELGWRLPELHRPGWVKAAIGGLIALQFVASLIAWGSWTGFAKEVFPVVIVSLLFGWIPVLALALYITRPFATRFAVECSTLRGTVAKITRMNLGVIARSAFFDHRQVWEVLRTLVAEQLGVRPEEVTESARFLEDLGLE